MSAVVDDVLQTRLDLVGLGEWTSGYGQAIAAVGLLDNKLGEVERRRISFGVAGLAVATSIVVGLGKATLAAADEQSIYNRAAANFKGAFPADEVASLAAQMQSLTGVADDQIGSFIGLLGTFNLSKRAASELALPILNAAEALKAQGVSTEGLAVQIGKAAQTGDASPLRRVGIIIDDVGFKSLTAEQRVAALAKALNNQGGADAAERFKKTLPGAIQAATNAVGDIGEGIGNAFTEPATQGAESVEKWARGIANLPEGTLRAFGYTALFTAAALTVLSGKAVLSLIDLGKLATENAKLTNENLKAGNAAKSQAGSEADAGRAMKGAAADATLLAAELNNVAAAHNRAGAAAQVPGSSLPEAVAGTVAGAAGTAVAKTNGGSKSGGSRKRGRVTDVAAEIAAELAADDAKTGSVDDAITAIRNSASSTRQVAKNAVAAEISAEIARDAVSVREQLVEEAVDAVRNGPAPATTVGVRELRQSMASPAKRGLWERLRRPRLEEAVTYSAANALAPGAAVEGAAAAGMGSRIGSFMGSPAGILTAMAAEIALSQLPDEGPAGLFKGAASGAIAGASTGALLGSVVPGLGNAAGAAIGGVVGGTAGYFNAEHQQHTSAANTQSGKGADPVVEKLQKIIDQQQQQIDELRGIRTGALVSGKDVPGAQQRALASMGQLIA